MAQNGSKWPKLAQKYPNKNFKLRTQIDLKGETTKQDNHDYFSLFVQAQDDLKQVYSV